MSVFIPKNLRSSGVSNEFNLDTLRSMSRGNDRLVATLSALLISERMKVVRLCREVVKAKKFLDRKTMVL